VPTEKKSKEAPGTYVTNPTQQVVVVDDSATQIAIYERSIKSLTVQLNAFRATDDALEFLHRTNIDLLFLDLVMTGTDGMTFLREFRRLDLHAATNVVIITAKDYAQDRALAKELGALDYLVKPLRSQEIRDIICTHTAAKSSANDYADS
jgi:DNA-binding response OmpR family regulator